MAFRVILAVLFFAVLGGCASRLTSPETGVNQCSSFLERADGGVIPSLTGLYGQSDINMLILSGGGKYGAYGAGVLKGWSEAERDGTLGAGSMRRNSITIVTGISTGALQATAATVGNAIADPDARIRGPDTELIQDYVVDDEAIGKPRSLIASLSSNGLRDIRNGLEPKVRAVTERYWSAMRALPPQYRTYVGMVNLRDGRFYVADLVRVAKSDNANAKDCYTEFVLASAAVPVEFPPRFIDGSPYVDGGVRFGTFLGEQFAAAARNAIRRTDAGPTVSFRAIVNGTLSPNDGSDDAARAAACDAATLDTIEADCIPAKNTLLGIASRAAGQILVDQIYRDSARRLQLELERAKVLGAAGFLFVPNARIAQENCRSATDQGFDPSFMRCLTAIGVADGRAQDWIPIDDLPRAGMMMRKVEAEGAPSQ